MQKGGASNKIVHLYIRHKQKSPASFGLRQDFAEKAKIANFIMRQNNKKRKIKNSYKNTNKTPNKKFNVI